MTCECAPVPSIVLLMSSTVIVSYDVALTSSAGEGDKAYIRQVVDASSSNSYDALSRPLPATETRNENGSA
jgi:hypothetical protein